MLSFPLHTYMTHLLKRDLFSTEQSKYEASKLIKQIKISRDWWLFFGYCQNIDLCCKNLQKPLTQLKTFSENNKCSKLNYGKNRKKHSNMFLELSNAVFFFTTLRIRFG